MKRYATAIAIALTLLGQQGDALAQSGGNTAPANYVMPGCRNWVNDADRGYFLQGLCAGMVRVIVFLGPHVGICRPTGVTGFQATKVILLCIDQRPERMHEQFEVLALEALQQAWPCQR